MGGQTWPPPSRRFWGYLEVGDDDFYIDLLFYRLKLRCFVVIDLDECSAPRTPGR
jgi:hypothetical protein